MLFFFFNDTATTEIYTLSLHDALPIFLNVTLIILTLSVSRLLNLLLRLVAFLLFLNPQCYKPQRSEERFSRNAETDLVCRLLLEKKKTRYASHCRVCQWRSHR